MLKRVSSVYFKFSSDLCQNDSGRFRFLLCVSRTFCKEHETSKSVISSNTRFQKPNLIRGDRKHLGSSVFQNKKSVLTTTSNNILDSIQSLKHTEEVLNYLKKNSNLDFQLYSPIFELIFQLQKSGKTNLSNEALCRTKEIEHLSQEVKKNARFLSLHDIINILKIVLFFGVSSNSMLCQHLLQMITKQVNRLSIQQIIFLNYILMKCPPSPLVEGVKIALPIVFETNIRNQLNYENSKAIASAISYGFRSTCSSDETLEYLVDAALRVKDRFEPGDATNVIISILNTRKSLPKLLELYREMLSIVNTNVLSISFVNLNNIVRQSVLKFVHYRPEYYSHELMKNAIDCVTQKKIDAVQTGLLLKSFNSVAYYCPELIDYMDEYLKNYEDFSCLSTPQPIFAFVTCCSNCLYRPKFWDLYEDKLVSYIDSIKSPDLPMVRIVTDLIIMRCWPTSLIQYCFQKDFLDKFLKIMSGMSYLDYVCTLNLYQIVKCFYPGEYTGPYPPADVLEKASDMIFNHRTEYPLLGALQRGLGGPQCVISGVQTKLGHFIDHLIVKRKSGQIFAINPNQITASSKTIVETLEIPEDSYLIGIVSVTPSAFCLDGIRLRGKMKIYIRSIESLGIVTIPIHLVNWNNLPDYEKIPYLMNKINTRSPINLSTKEDLHSSVQFEDC